MENAYQILVRKPVKKKQLQKSKSRWEDNINMDLKETECESVDWIQDPEWVQWWALMNMVMNLWIL
jgi:hypothetical protein